MVEVTATRCRAPICCTWLALRVTVWGCVAFPMMLSTVGSTVVATWAVLDVWVTRQVWNQRHGVVSVPSSSARQLRRERRAARRAARAAEREAARIRRRDRTSVV